MKLEDQVCAIEYAQRLKEVGIKQDSLIHWMKRETVIHGNYNEEGDWIREHEKTEYEFVLGSPYVWNIEKECCWSAFTVSELGKLIPYSIDDGVDFYYPTYTKHHKYYRVQLIADTNKMLESLIGDTEANARALMLIYLIENGLVKV